MNERIVAFGLLSAMLCFMWVGCARNTETPHGPFDRKTRFEDVQEETHEAFESMENFTQESSDDVVRNMQARMDEYNRELDQLKAKSGNNMTQQKRDAINSLEARLNQLELDLKHLKSSSGKATANTWQNVKEEWSELKNNMSDFWDDLKNERA